MMRNRTIIALEGVLATAVLSLAACVDAGPVSVTLPSVARLDGSVDSQGVVDASSGEMEIGRNASGYGVRGFLTFDVSTVVPLDDTEAIELVSADLSVYENNVNLDPWDSMGNARLEIVDAGDTLDVADFDRAAIADAGLASSASSWLEFHALSVTPAVQQVLDDTDPSALPELQWLQFRVRFEDDTDTNDATLTNHHWDLNTAEATEPAASGPELTLVYRTVAR